MLVDLFHNSIMIMGALCGFYLFIFLGVDMCGGCVCLYVCSHMYVQVPVHVCEFTCVLEWVEPSLHLIYWSSHLNPEHTDVSALARQLAVGTLCAYLIFNRTCVFVFTCS